MAVCDPRVEKANAAAEYMGPSKLYTDVDKFLADEDVDAVEVLTPTMLHKEHVVSALEAGKHVSCQKPIANTVSDGQRWWPRRRPRARRCGSPSATLVTRRS